MGIVVVFVRPIHGTRTTGHSVSVSGSPLKALTGYRIGKDLREEISEETKSFFILFR